MILISQLILGLERVDTKDRKNKTIGERAETQKARKIDRDGGARTTNSEDIE